jgi:hypothetical protein
MRTVLLGAAPLVVVALIFGAVVLWDRLREPHRDPTQPMAVVDSRTYRNAQRRIGRLLDAGDTMRARHLMHAICVWLRSEIHTGGKSRRAHRAADLEQWQLRLEQLPVDEPTRD